jgi:hypothetical protein
LQTGIAKQACLKGNRYATVINVNSNTQVITNTAKTTTTGYNTYVNIGSMYLFGDMGVSKKRQGGVKK